MKCLVHTILVASLAAALVFPSVAGAGGDRFFRGLWQAVDTLDGSPIMVSISDNDRDGILEVRYTESFFATCIDKGFSGSPGIIEGSGAVADKTLTYEFSFKCYNPATNSLVEISSGTGTFKAIKKNLEDVSGNIYHKIGRR